MAADVLIVFLPNEILEHILERDALTFRDICNFGSTCNKFRSVVCSSNKVWKSKFQQKWPGLLDIYDKKRTFIWKDELKVRLHYERTICQLIAEMSPKFYKKEEVSNSELSEFEKMMHDHEYAYFFMVDELMSILNDGDIGANLTQKYYTEKVIRYVRQMHLTQEWHRFIALPPEDQLLEKGAVLVAQWCQPMVEIPYVNIASQMDVIASQVKNVLQLENGSHPLFSVPPEHFQLWRNKNIDGNQWKPSESHQVLTALCNVLFQQMGFHGNNEMYYCAENSFINKVMEYRRGIPITLSIVFESVARRLGVKCEPVSFPAHFLLRWRERYTVEENGAVSPYYYIDVFNGGQFLTKRNCPRYSPNSQCPMRGMSVLPATPVQVIERMANNLEVAGRQRTHMNGRGAQLRSALELLHLVNPSDMNCILHLARFYMLNNMDLGGLRLSVKDMQNDMQNGLEPRARDQARHIMQMLQVYESHQYRDSSSVPEVEPKLRTGNVEYAVGMIMRHLQYNYTCVISGWDPLCTASQEWIYQMGVESLPNKDQQPFYNVLAEDGSSRYVAQENLSLATEPCWISHVEVGRYFQRFCHTHYVPNMEKAEEYPQDAGVRLHYLALAGIAVQEELREL